MNRNLLLFIIVLSLFGCKKDNTISDRQSEIFVKYFGSFSDDISHQIINTDDGGFIFTGTVSSLTQGKDLALIKTDKFGNEEWSKTYGDSLDNFGNGILIANDAIFLLGTTTDTLFKTNLWLLKLSMNGSLEWSKQFGGTENEIGSSIIKGNDSGFIIAGTSTKENLGHNNAEGSRDIIVIKTDNDGRTIWEEYFGANGNEDCSEIIPFSGGYALIGSSDSYGSGSSDIFTAIIKEDGKSPDFNTFGGSSNDIGNSIISVTDGFIITGTSSSFDVKSQIYCVHTSFDLNTIIWEKNYGGAGNETGNKIISTANDQYLIVGSTDGTESQGLKDQFLVNLSSDGDTLWTNTFGYTDNDAAYAAVQCADGGFAILGTTGFDNNQMISLIKTNSNGKINE